MCQFKIRGSDFLRKWMRHLEEHSDLRYPDVGELLREHGQVGG